GILIGLVLALALPASAGAASEFFIRGGGDGHGIGMSQYGSYGFALHGKDYRWILGHYYQHTTLGNADPNKIVRVLVGTHSAAFAGATRVGNKKINPSATYWIRPQADGSLVVVNQKGKKVGRFQAPLSATGPGPLALAGVGTYRGSLVFSPNGSGGVQTVDYVGLDDYVRGVISWEMPSSWAPEALKVQAVAARTYAITTSVGGGTFDLYSDTRSQMYGGVAAETPSTNAAVAATRGQVVTYHGTPVVTYFSSSSGGYTESIQNVWTGSQPEPWLVGVPDPYDGVAGNPNEHWADNMSLSAAASKLGHYVKGQLLGIQVTKHGVSPRVLLADVVGTKGRTQITGDQLQSLFGLQTTLASFTTISTNPGAPPQSHSRRRGGAGHRAQQAEAQAVLALPALVRDIVAGAVPGLHGTIMPARRGGAVTIQQQSSHGWKTVAHTTVGSGGSYGLQLPSAGTYRVVYGSFYGPAVAVS
ncbi:MAG: SpoIID/LytB domain-containing protein, partial [Solirubrobacteraceae bacterium]